MRKSPQPDSSTFGPDEYWEKLEATTALSLPFYKRVESGTSYRFYCTAFRKKCRMTWAALIKAVEKETVPCTGVFTLQEQRDKAVQ
jgi:hypothetical protein